MALSTGAAIEQHALDRQSPDVRPPGQRDDAPSVMLLADCRAALLEAEPAGLPTAKAGMPGCTDGGTHGIIPLRIRPRRPDLLAAIRS